MGSESESAADSAPVQARCPVCGGCDCRERWRIGDRLFRTTRAEFSVRGCGDCGACFLFPPPAEAERADHYPAGYWVGPSDRRAAPGAHGALVAIYRRFALRDHLRFVGRILAEQRSRGWEVRILDLGCGDGSFLEALDEGSGVGMDLAGGALRACRARGLEAVRGEPARAPFGDGTFSVITMLHLLEHVLAPDPVLADARRLLRAGGALVVQVPNLRSWQARLLGRRWAGLDVPRHLVDYSDATLCRALARSGFEVVRLSTFSLRDNPTTLVNSLCPALYPLARMARESGGAGLLSWLSDLAYLALTWAALPFTLLESGFGRGAAVMVEARPAAPGKGGTR